MLTTSPHPPGNNTLANKAYATSSRNKVCKPKSPKKAVKRRTPKNDRRGVLKTGTIKGKMIKHSTMRADSSTQPTPVDSILCIDEGIIESSPKNVLMGFLRDVQLPFRGLTKSKLQFNLRRYLQNRIMQCPLPATLLKRAKFWRVSVARKPPSKKGVIRFIVRTEWGQLGGKRFGERKTPQKIIPRQTMNRISISNEYNTKDQAVRVARLKIKQKLKAGYYLSTEGSLPWCEAREKSTPAIVRSDNHRKLKFAGVLKVREFHKSLPAMSYIPVEDAENVNFMSDNEP